jgi:hypothetical protein
MVQKVLHPKHLNEQDQKNDETLIHKRDREAEPAFPINKPDNDLKTLDPKLILKALDEAVQTVGSHKGGPDDNATEQTMI